MHNATALEALLMGAPGPYRDAVLFNAAGALMVAGEVDRLGGRRGGSRRGARQGTGEGAARLLDCGGEMNKLEEICATKREEVRGPQGRKDAGRP